MALICLALAKISEPSAPSKVAMFVWRLNETKLVKSTVVPSIITESRAVPGVNLLSSDITPVLFLKKKDSSPGNPGTTGPGPNSGERRLRFFFLQGLNSEETKQHTSQLCESIKSLHFPI